MRPYASYPPAVLIVLALVLALAAPAASRAGIAPPMPRPENLAAPGPEAEPVAVEEVHLAALALPPGLRDPDARCTPDGTHCVRLASYTADVCRMIEAVAEANALDANFFARLLWKESLFNASAVSHKGAQGIAQFMPGTAALRGLKDPFNPAEAMAASAHYLAELSERFGNIGLAAVAYNGGEARAARFIARESGLPDETRNYVQAITGHPAESWRDAPPRDVDLALAKDKDFQSACTTQAAGRTLREFRTAPVTLPWGVVIAFNRDRTGAERQVSRLQNRHRAVLRGEAVTYARERRPGLRGMMWYAQVGRSSREAADTFCRRLRSTGGDCMVMRN